MLKKFTIIGLLLVWFGCRMALAAEVTVPNILLILSDDHSVPYLGCYGNPDLKTPNLDKFAADGVLFTQAFTSAPQCVQSRAAIMTGRNPLDCGMARFSAPLPREITAYPELLRQAGYFTGICGRSYHLDGSHRKLPQTKATFEKYQLATFRERVDFLRQNVDDPEVLGEFQDFMDAWPADKPFFVQVSYHDPHRGFPAWDYAPDPNALTIPPPMPDTVKLRKDLSGHYGQIQRLDENVGLLLQELDKRGVTDSTLVVFMGDNGAALLRGKGTLYDYGLHVPLIMRWPKGIKPGQTLDTLIAGTDIAPTLLDAARVKIPQEITGVSFWSVLQGKPHQERPYVYAVRGSHGTGLTPGNSIAFDLSRAVFNKRYRLIYNPLWQLPYLPVDFNGKPFWKELQALHGAGKLDKKFSQAFFKEKRPVYELYDLQSDPYEFNNLAGKKQVKAVERKLKDLLHEWMILNRDFPPLPK